MDNWNELDGSNFFNMVFTYNVKIEEIKLFSLIIDHRNPQITMDFDIKELPDRPPIKWTNMGFNTCRIGITCSEVNDLLLKNLPHNLNIKIKIEKIGARFKISGIADDFHIEFTAAFLRLRDPSVYLNDEQF